MSLRTNTKIEFIQQGNIEFPNRNKTFILDFVNTGEINSSWVNLTDTAKLRFPRNVFVEDENGNAISWTGKSIYGTDGSESPLFMRGDKIKISLGYFIDDMQGGESSADAENLIFEGYITKIKNRIPIEIECEDEMWKLKQINVANKTYLSKDWNVKTMLEDMLKGTKYTVSDGDVTTKIGDFRTENETVADILDRIRRDGGLYSYFRNGQLRCSSIVYYPEDRNEEVFEFQENIINDNLQYTRKEDVRMAVKAFSQAIGKASGTNADGTDKTKKVRLEVLVGIKKDGSIGEITEAYSGSVFSFPVMGATSKEQLTERAKAQFLKLYYTGFRGDFLTFGIPVVRHGDAAIIRDKVIPERNGTYLIKQVTTTFGMQGYRQKILLHLRIDKGFTKADLNAGL